MRFTARSTSTTRAGRSRNSSPTQVRLPLLPMHKAKSKLLAILSAIVSLIMVILPFILYPDFQLFWLILTIAVLSLLLAVRM